MPTSPRRSITNPRSAMMMAGLAVVILLAVAMSVRLIPRTQSVALKEWQGRITASAVLRGRAIDRFLRDEIDDLHLVAQYPSVVAALRHGGRDAAHVQDILRLTAASLGLEDLCVVTAGGAVVFASAPGADCRRPAVQGTEPIITVEKRGGELVVALAAPVHDGRLLGYVIERMPPDRDLLALLANDAPATVTASASIAVRQPGGVVWLSSRGTQPGPRAGADSTDLARVVERRPTVPFGRYTDGQGERILAASVALATAPWTVIASVDEREALTPYRREVQRAALGVLLFLAAVSLAVYGWFRVQRSRTAYLLAREKARVWLLLNEASDAILFVDPAGKIRDANRRAEELYGWTRDELHGMDVVTQLRRPDLRTSVPSTLDRIMEEGHLLFETVQVHRDGTEIPVEISATRIEQDDAPMVLAIVRDIRARRHAEELEEQVRQSQKMEAVGRLAGGVAHDFNNLLTVMFAETGRALDLARDGELRGSLRFIEEAARQAAGLTRQLLAFSRRQVLRPRTISLGDLVAASASMLRRVLGEDVAIRTVIAPDPLPVRVDPGQIDQVIMNLSVNARDAMPDGGELTLTVQPAELDAAFAREHPGIQPGPHVMLEVRDTGEGMTPEVLAHVFEPFFTTKELGRGTGLGLSTVYGIVQQSRGTVTVESAPGAGAVFRVYFPRASAAQLTAQPDAATGPARGTETILLAEDDPAVRKVVASTLQRCGFAVLEAADADQALRLAGTHAGRIHLLLTDVVMPGGRGDELARRFRAAGTDVPVLFMSGYTDTAKLFGEDQLPRADFLHKPFTIAELTGKIRALLDARAA